jgi:hypothetical protein
MPKSRNHIRLDKIEVQLTPKEWAIKLVDEIRRYPSKPEFLRAVAKRSYRESPYVKPFFALTAQAEDRHPGKTSEDIRAAQQLSNDLRREYQALKSLINMANDELRTRTEQSRQKGSALASQLNQLIRQDVFAQTSETAAAWIVRRKTTGAEEKERQSILEELANVARAAGSRSLLFSLANDWADDAAVLLMEMFSLEAAVRELQKNYFDGHAILSPSVEHALETTIQLVSAVVGTFNRYVSATANGFSRDSRRRTPSPDEVRPNDAEESYFWKCLGIDVEAIRTWASELAPQAFVSAWENEARHNAIVDILRETSEHESVVWHHFCQKVGMNPSAQ